MQQTVTWRILFLFFWQAKLASRDVMFLLHDAMQPRP